MVTLLSIKSFDQTIVLNGRAHRFEAAAILALATDDEAIHGHLLNPTILHPLQELRVVQLVGLTGAGEVVHHGHQDRRNDQPQNQVFAMSFNSLPSGGNLTGETARYDGLWCTALTYYRAR